MEKKNREQRRREKFGHAGGATKEVWPQSEANPAFGHAHPPDESLPDDAGPGAGGETAKAEGARDRKQPRTGRSAKR